jgi:cytochrome c-type biogenesis protein
MIASAAPPLGYAFAAGMVATLNPCGFALLPAYLAYYLGQTGDEPDPSTPRALLRAVGVGASLTAGFLVVFGLMGIVWSAVSSTIGGRLPWVTAVLGVAVVILGIAMLRGFEPVVRIPHLNVDKGGQEMWSTFLFGVSYAVASLSCTIPIFSGLLSTTFSESFSAGVRTFIAFGLGMGALVTVLTIGVALTRQGLLHVMRRLMPHFGRISGALLVLTGSVVAYYGWAEARQLDGRTGGTGFAAWLQDVQSSVSDWIDHVGTTRLGLACGLIIAGALAIGWVARGRTDGDGSRSAPPVAASPVASPLASPVASHDDGVR